MWRRLRVLNPKAAFAVASLSAAIIACPHFLTSYAQMKSGLFLHHPLLSFFEATIIFMTVVALFISYYHAGVVGAILSLVFSWFAAHLLAIWVLLVVSTRRGWVEVVSYATFVLLIYVAMFWLHVRADRSDFVRDWQKRLLHYQFRY
jgi:hypothetical protein